MNKAAFESGHIDSSTEGVIKLAIMAVGGQGGAVLTGWIETLARAEGYACQATSVSGVAQRTGATIYYVEMAHTESGLPVFALAPAAGDVDILIAAEMMEAGRAIMRGFVTPDRTTLIASSHRSLSVAEKMVPGDGIADPTEVRAAAEIAAARFICLDMEELAVRHASMISATLFGALAGAECLPFEKAAFERAIESGGRGVHESLRAFHAAYDASRAGKLAPEEPPRSTAAKIQILGPDKLCGAWGELVAQVAALPNLAQPIAVAGLRKVVEFMDPAYGQEYLDRLSPFAASDQGAEEHLLTREAAKYIANAMAYDDVIRVADLKTRAERGRRIADEMKSDCAHIVLVTEYFHPRAAEIVGLLPARMGRRLEKRPSAMERIDRWFGKNRRLRSDRFLPFLMLYILGGLKQYRRRTLRHNIEIARLNGWLARAMKIAERDNALAIEILHCGRLIKGYSGTHARGLSKFSAAMATLDTFEREPNAAEMLRAFRLAALEVENMPTVEDAGNFTE